VPGAPNVEARDRTRLPALDGPDELCAAEWVADAEGSANREARVGAVRHDEVPAVAGEHVRGARIGPLRVRIGADLAERPHDERRRVVVDDVRVELLESRAGDVAARPAALVARDRNATQCSVAVTGSAPGEKNCECARFVTSSTAPEVYGSAPS
jgi:hypothetical protein